MYQYYNALSEVKDSEFYAPAARENMPSTKVVPDVHMRFSFSNNFPILCAKEMPFYSIAAELIGFLQGVTDVRIFDKLGTKVWWDNAYKWNVADKGLASVVTKAEYIDHGRKSVEFGVPYFVEINDTDVSYDLGAIYSKQWRDYNNGYDQLKRMIGGIEKTPFSRYHVMTAWNPIEMNNVHTSQPNCHVYFQATVCLHNDVVDVEDYLKNFLSDSSAAEFAKTAKQEFLFTHLTQRSCDMFLGVPFNITSYALKSVILGILTNTVPLRFDWTGVNAHIYGNHGSAVETYFNQYSNCTYGEEPKLNIDVDFFRSFDNIMSIKTLEDIKKVLSLENYIPAPKIKAPLSVGL